MGKRKLLVRHVVQPPAHGTTIDFPTHPRKRRKERSDGRCRKSEEERRALRGSKFAPLPSQSTSSRSQPRLAHPGGPLKTNKAAALAKFLERKLHQDPNALSSINPQILDLAVRNAKASVLSSGTSGSGTTIRHVDTFDDPEVSFDEGEAMMNSEPRKQKKKNKKKNKKKKRQKIVDDSEFGVGKKPKKKLRL